MSVETDNKNFVTSVLSWASAGAPDFSKYTYGLWSSVFENVNNGLGGYSIATPLLEDIASSNFLITGKKYSILDFDGKNPEAKFFLTRGIKGIDGYEFLEPLADITDSFVSGAKPQVIMPDMDYAGKIYRRTEVTGNQMSFISKNNILAVSGEDWQQTSISVSSNNTDIEYSYEDSSYTGYSNEVVTRYKFLYDDSGNSMSKDISYFDIPYQIEAGSALKFRIARKSDPLGFSAYPDYAADGKVGIDYSKYKDEISGVIDGSLNYNLDQTYSFTLTQDNIKDIFNNNSSVRMQIKGSQDITGLIASKITAGEFNYLKLSLLATGDIESVYKLNGEVERYKLNTKTDILGYVMSEYKMSDSSAVVTIPLAANDQVYPRVQQNGSSYGLNEVKDLVDFQEIIESEQYAQDLQAQEGAEEEEDEDTFKALADGMKTYTDQLNAALSDDDGSYEGSNSDIQKIIETRVEQDQQDTLDLINQNNELMSYKVALPNFPLPKKTYTSDYFSNYLNTGERYVLSPLSNYTSIPIFASYGNEYGTLAYYINEDPARGKITNQPYYRTVVNSTCKGIYIDESTFCKGDTAIYDNTRYNVDDLNIQNGLATQIPSNGIIKKDNYVNPENWKTAVNYYYTKNYVASFTVQPSFSEQDYLTLFNTAFEKVNSLIGGPSAKSADSNSFYKKGGVKPRIFVEREIYTEKYNQNQIEEFNRSFTTGVYITPDADLSVEEPDKLYCVQSYDVGNFTKLNQQFFYPIQNYNETLEFLEFFPESTTASAGYDKTVISSYTVDTDSAFGNILFEDKVPNYKRIFRAEYVVGTASLFSYNNFSSSAVAGAISGGIVTISNRDPKQYAYHLYSYVTAGGQLTLVKSNVINGYSVAGITNPVVIKFTKLEYTDNTYTYTIVDADGNSKDFAALAASVSDANSVLISSNLVKINVQTYEYNIISPDKSSCWWIFNENPVNNNIYGERDTLGLPQPRFFEDDAEETKTALGDLLLFPNGPYTSKNYEGTPVTLSDINAFANGLFENNIYVIEEDKTNSLYEANCSIDFEDNGTFTKQATPQIIDNGKNAVSFSKTRRLKITKIIYNFYVKDLVLIGDAGFPYSINYNGGWDYKLQYRIKNSADSWVTLDEDAGFTKDKISVQSSQISPYYYSSYDLVIPNFLSMIAFKTNLSLFLDDDAYEFRIAKYEKLELSTQNVDVLKKTNFLPTKVDWTADIECAYYNIYQKDRAGNLTLIKTQNESASTTYAIPDVKQMYVDDGVFNFGGLNGIGYYDIVVSGVVPASSNNQSSISNQYGGIAIGNSNEEISVRTKIDSNFKYTTKSIANTTYSSIIDFNNPETKNSNFDISPNYNGYYFIADGATSVSFNNVATPFEAYVANINAASCSVNGTAVATNNVAIIQGPSAPSTAALSSNPSSTFDLSDALEESVIYLKNGITITDDDNLTVSKDLKFKAINDSSSSITIQYKSTSVSVLANKTAFLNFSSTTVTQYSTAISNLTTQDDSIYYPNAGLINIDHTNLTLDGYSSYGDLPIYNASKESLSVDTLFYGSFNLDPESFNYFTQTPTVCLNDKKSYFDDIKIYLVGGDNSESNGIFYLKDDTEIILNSYAENNTDKSTDEYYFIKDESVNRNLNIKITNGSSSFIVPRANQDFKLSVEKTKGGVISYKILYPSDNPFFEIDETLEQMVLLNSNSVQNIDLVYLEAKIPKNAFVYFVNKSASPVYFYRGKVSNVQNTLADNQIARASIVTSGSSKGIKIDILNTAYSHFEFKIDPATHLASAINILNLDFCGTQIEVPSVSNFAGKDLFLICRNRTVPNKIDSQRVISTAGLIQDSDNPDTKDVNEAGNISERSISLRLYKNGVSDANPTLERTSFLDFSADNSNPILIQNDVTIKEDKTEYFYINDSANLLNTFTLRDYYSRNSSYKGKIFTQSKKPLTVLSFDRNNKFEYGSKDPTSALSFDYNPDNFMNGRLLVENKSDATVYSKQTEKDSTGLTFSTTISADQIVINFAYDSVIVTNISSKRLNKNRLVKRTGANITYPVYNKKEFFLASLVDSNVVLDQIFEGVSYYKITATDTDIDKIIIPDSSARSFIIKNTSARAYTIETLSYNGSTYSTTISPSEQIKLSYSSGWSKASNSEDIIDSALIIKVSNQQFELEVNHPLKTLWESEFNIDNIGNAFIGATGEDTSILLDQEYNYVDYLNAAITAVSGYTIYCFGRKRQVTNLGANNYLVNAFYLFVYYHPDQNAEGKIVKHMQVYSTGKGEFFEEVVDLKIVEEKHIDLSKYLINYNAISSLPSVVLIPIVDQLSTYYLPNLDNLITDFDSGLTKSIGDWISGTKIIFVNLAVSNDSAPNKIINYSTSTTHSIYNNLSTLSFTAGSSDWSISAGTKPEVQTVIPSVKRINATSSTGSSEIYDGSEFVYLYNFSKFNIDLSSFKNSQLGSFYLFNSALNNVYLKRSSKQSQLQAYRFSKISANQTTGTFYAQDLGINGSAPFATIELQLTKAPNENTVNDLYPNLKIGTLVKIAALINNQRSTYLFKYNIDLKAEAISIKDESFASLDLARITSSLPNHRLFIYGSSQINEAGNFFDSYNLKLLNTASLGSGKFYIQNNTPYNLGIYFKDSDQESDNRLDLPPKRMVEISSSSASFMEYHKKGEFYISKRRENTNFIHKINSSLFLDSLLDYKEINDKIEKVTDSASNNMVSFLNNNFPFCYYSYYDKDGFYFSSYSENRKAFLLNNSLSMNLAGASFSIEKPNLLISALGHYIFNNSDNNLNVSPVASNMFLVNNCAQDILVKKIDGKTAILFRNTVLIINSSAPDRYLKKAKRRDEFYCIFNPKTTISTQREITLNTGIPRNNDVFPILDLNNDIQQSYIKLLPKLGSSSTIYLNLVDYYNGKDVPTDSPQNVVGYELGIGHETFYKFLFFNPSNSTYTMPGIKSGETYEVSIDYGLFRDLKTLPNSDGDIDLQNLPEPCVIYKGKIYTDQQTFKGEDVSNYEVRYPNYVKLNKVILNIEKSFDPETKADEEIEDGLTLVEESLDLSSLFNQAVVDQTPSKSNSVISWIPQNENAFWLESQFNKDLWSISSVDPSTTFTISYPEGSTSRYVKFTKCLLKKEDLKTVVSNYSFDLASALQDRKEIADQRDLTIGLDAGLEPKQLNKVKGWLNQDQNKQDFLLNISEMPIGFIYEESLLPPKGSTQEVVKSSSCQIKFQLNKLNRFPNLNFEDMSKDETVKLLNGK
jgi:hypothetical protein